MGLRIVEGELEREGTKTTPPNGLKFYIYDAYGKSYWKTNLDIYL